MRPKTQITAVQAALVAFTVTIGTVYFPLAGILVPVAGSASWLSVVIAGLMTSPWLLLVAWLTQQAPKGDWGLAVKTWLGPVVGSLFLLWFAATWFALGSMLLAEVSFVFHAIALPATPPRALMLALFVLVVLTDLKGIEVYMRTMQVLLMLGAPLVGGFLLGVIPLTRLPNLMPLWGEGPLPVIKAAYLTTPFAFTGVLFVLFVGVLVKDRQELFKSSLAGVMAAMLLLAGVVALTIGNLGCGITQSYIYPTVPLMQSARVSSFLTGLELFVYPLWLLTSYAKTTVSFLLASESIRGIMPWIKQPWRTLGLAGVFLGIAFIPPNVETTSKTASMIDFYLTMPLAGILPLVAAWVLIRKKVGK